MMHAGTCHSAAAHRLDQAAVLPLRAFWELVWLGFCGQHISAPASWLQDVAA